MGKWGDRDMRDGEMRTWIRGTHVLGGNGPVDAVVMYYYW